MTYYAYYAYYAPRTAGGWVHLGGRSLRWRILNGGRGGCWGGGGRGGGRGDSLGDGVGGGGQRFAPLGLTGSLLACLGLLPPSQPNGMHLEKPEELLLFLCSESLGSGGRCWGRAAGAGEGAGEEGGQPAGVRLRHEVPVRRLAPGDPGIRAPWG